MSLVKRVFSLLVPVISALTLSACAGVTPTFTAERPRAEAFRTVLKQEMSSLNFSIEATSNDLSKALNQSIRNELYKGSTKTRGLTADILRNGQITVSAADNYLYFTIPITMSLSYGIFETKAIPLNLKFKANARITSDWKLSTEIYYLGLSDLLAEDVGIGPLSIRPRSIVEGITQPVQRMLSDLISKRINDLFPLKEQVVRAWDAVQKPVLANRNYNAWLKLTPREVMLSPLYAQNNRVRLNMGINTFAELVVGPEPAARPLVPLPNLKLVNNFDKSFRIALNADLFYKDILSIASPLLINKEFDSDGKTVVIKDIDLYGNGDKFVIKIATKGSLDGVFYLTGKPRFDPQTNIFSVEDVDFDMQTQSLLLQSANWFLHSMIKSRIQEKLNMNLTQKVEQSREMVQKAIAQVQLADHVLLKGNIKTLKLNDVLVQKDRISIRIYTEGESAILFQ
jgi:archaellum component FlaF (FlaF/FlaG flagellin family)